MNRTDYDQLIDTHQSILPVPIQDNPAPASPEGIPYGKTKRPMPLKPYPNSKYDKVQYCNQIPPAPRSQDLNVPYQGPECPFTNPLPYTKDACYLTSNEGQGVVGLVCNSAGGSDNSNFARGNQFGVNYEWNQSNQFKKTKSVYKENPPVQTNMDEMKPMVIYDKNTFYPQPDWNLQKDPNYQTYMEPSRFTPQGLPTYTFPYEVLNPMKPLSEKEYEDKMNKREATNDPVISDYPNNIPYPDFNKNILLENFEDVTSKNISLVSSSTNDRQDNTSIEGFQNMLCPHRQNCPFCKNCPYGPNCKCGRGCPYCQNCPEIKRTVLDNFTTQAVEAFENQNTNNFTRFFALIVSLIIIFYIISLINKYVLKL